MCDIDVAWIYWVLLCQNLGDRGVWLRLSGSIIAFHVSMCIYIMDYYNLVGGIPTPLKNDGVRHLGWWHSQLFLESQNPFHGSKKNQPLQWFIWWWLNSMFVFQRVNMVNTQISSTPPWNPGFPSGKPHGSPPGLGPPLPLFTFPGVLASPRKIQEFSNESRELWLTEMNIQVLWLES